jgi:TRAP-type C4-dicarboxylate transport system substrate-binding protein
MVIAMGAASLLSFVTQAAGGQITLKLAEQFSPNHYISKLGAQAWMEAVARRTGGRVKFEYYPSEQLARSLDMLDTMSLGIADVGYVAFPEFAARMPLISNVTLLPVWPDALTGMKALYPMVISPGPILERDFLKNGIRPLMPLANGVFRLWTRDKSVHRVADMKGLKIRSTGGVQDEIIRAMGGVPVQIPAPEMYEALERKIIDGVLMPASSIPSYHIDELVRYCNWGVNVSGGSLGYVVNSRTWDSLPEDIRRIMQEEAERALLNISNTIVERDEEFKGKLAAKGIAIYEPTPQERQQWIDVQKPVEAAAIADMNRKGLPAAEVLAELRRRVRAATVETGAPGARR